MPVKDLLVPPHPIIMEREPPQISEMRLTPKEINITKNKRPVTMPPKTNIKISHDDSNEQKITISNSKNPGTPGVVSGKGITAPGNTSLHIKRNDSGSDSDNTAKEMRQRKRPRDDITTPKFIKGGSFSKPAAPGIPSYSNPQANLGATDFKSFANPSKSRLPPQGAEAFGTYSGDRKGSDASENEFSEDGSGPDDMSTISDGGGGGRDDDDTENSNDVGYPSPNGDFPNRPNMMGQDDAPTKQLSKSERQQLKYDLLSKIQALERKGIHTSKRFTSKHKLVHIQGEYNRLSQLLANEAGVKFGRKLLMGFVSVTEWLNNRFDPVGAKLEGWSESVMENIEDFDHSLERIVEKWTSHVEVAPEMELMTALSGSAFMFHMSKSILSNPSAIFQAMGSQKPDMMENMMRKMMGGGGGGGGNKPQEDSDDDSDEEMSPPKMNLNPMQQAGIATRGKGIKPKKRDESSDEGSEEETDLSSDEDVSSTDESSSSSSGGRGKKPLKAKMVSVPDTKKKGKK